MDSPLKQGMRLGRYSLLAELGHGGMASVWVALEKTPSGAQRFVALKVMLPSLAAQSNFRSMFLDEGQLVRSIEHPNVVRVFEVGEDRGLLYMAMEWIEGDSLHGLIRAARKRRAIPAEMAVRIVADVAAGLHHAHELRGWDGELRGVVHCDVSPQNILIGVDGQPKLVDFGVAHAAALSDDDRNQVRGKLGYMSPEQAYARQLDRRSDIFSMGIVLFELTTGKRLFGRKDPQQTLALVRSARVPIPSSVWPDYPEALGAIVLKALQREPRHRYQTAEEFKLALEHFLVERRTMISPAGVGSLLSRVLGERIRERRDQVQRALIEQKATISLPHQELLAYDVTGDSDIVASAEGISDSDIYFEVDSGSISIISEGTGAQASQRSVSPHVVETPPAPAPPRKRVGLIVGAAAVVAVGVGAAVLAWPGRGAGGGPETNPQAVEAAQGVDAPTQKEGDEQQEGSTSSDAVSLDSIPVVPRDDSHASSDAVSFDSIPVAPKDSPSIAGGVGQSVGSQSNAAVANDGRPDTAAAGPRGESVVGANTTQSKDDAAGSSETTPPKAPIMSTDFLDKPQPRGPNKPAADDIELENPYR